MQSIKDILQGLPPSETQSRKIIGLRASSETEEPAESLDKRIAQIQAEIARRQEILKKAPVVTKVIKSPNESVGVKIVGVSARMPERAS